MTSGRRAGHVKPPARVRLDYGLRVLRQATGVLTARAGAAPRMTRQAVAPVNLMFDAALPAELACERAALERFDLYLFDAMNSSRLEGQIVFEYGILLRALERWSGLRVLDVGTGRSTFPAWMSHKGAVVTPLDLSVPAEASWGGFHGRVNRLIGRRRGVIRPVTGSMRDLPFADNSFDLVTSLSVVEHLDTDLPERTFVPYDEQQRRLARVLDETIRVTRPGGHLYVTSECCDYSRATTDGWRQAYYYLDGPALSGAWPVEDVPRLFYDHVSARGCDLVNGVQFAPSDISRQDRWTWRGPYFSGFSMLARKR